MTSSLVGSEMCIRDRMSGQLAIRTCRITSCASSSTTLALWPYCRCFYAVSYTHLTLPTICSV
eukprot:3184864-Prorocentrum_lima.AAC.1